MQLAWLDLRRELGVARTRRSSTTSTSCETPALMRVGWPGASQPPAPTDPVTWNST
jgi:hypothetical protein